MAFEAPWNHGAIEICDAVTISGAVNPANFLPVGNRQLKKQVSFPEQESLSLASRSNYQTKALGARCCVRWLSLHSRLEKAAVLCFCFHSKIQIGIRSLENIRVRVEIAQNRIFIRKPRRQIMRGSVKGFDLVLMTAAAGIITNIIVARIRRRGRTRRWLCLQSAVLTRNFRDQKKRCDHGQFEIEIHLG